MDLNYRITQINQWRLLDEEYWELADGECGLSDPQMDGGDHIRRSYQETYAQEQQGSSDLDALDLTVIAIGRHTQVNVQEDVQDGWFCGQEVFPLPLIGLWWFP